MTFKNQEKTPYQAATMLAHLEQIQLDRSVSDLQQSAPETMDSSCKNWNSFKSMSKYEDKCQSASNLCYENNQVTEIGMKKRDFKNLVKSQVRAQQLAELNLTTQSTSQDAHVAGTTPQQYLPDVPLSPDTLMLLLQISSIESSEAAPSKQLQEQIAQILSQHIPVPSAEPSGDAKELSDTRNGQECADLSTDSRSRAAAEVSNLDCTLNGDKIPGSSARRSKKRFHQAMSAEGPVQNLERSQDSSRSFPESPNKRLRGEEIIAQYASQNNAIKRQNMDFEHFKTVVRTHGKFWPAKSSMTKRLRETKQYFDSILDADHDKCAKLKEQPFIQNPSHLSRKNPPQIIKAQDEMVHLINSDDKYQIHQSQSQINGMSQEQSSNQNTINQKHDLILLNTFKQLEAQQKSILTKDGDEAIVTVQPKALNLAGKSCAEIPSESCLLSRNSALLSTQDNTPDLKNTVMKNMEPESTANDDVGLNLVHDLLRQIGTDDLNTLLSKMTKADADVANQAPPADTQDIHQACNTSQMQCANKQNLESFNRDRLSTNPAEIESMDIGQQAEALVNVIQNMMTQIITKSDQSPNILQSCLDTELSPINQKNNQSSSDEVNTDLLVALKNTLESLGNQLDQ